MFVLYLNLICLYIIFEIDLRMFSNGIFKPYSLNILLFPFIIAPKENYNNYILTIFQNCIYAIDVLLRDYISTIDII